MRYRTSALAFCALGLCLGVLEACGDDTGVTTTPDSGTPDATPDATADATVVSDGGSDARTEAAAEAGGDASDGGHDAGDAGDAGDSGDARADAGDAGTDATVVPSLPSFVTHFQRALNQQPEGLWEIGDAGTPLVGLAPLAQLVTVSSDGGFSTFGFISADAGALNTDTLGITTDTAGNVYVGVGAAASPDAGLVPAPGVYQFPVDGGAPTLFSSAPTMNFPNGLDFIGTTLFVADSGGTVFAISPSGVATIWSTDPLLQPNINACDAGPPLSLGANGIAHDANNVYVTNTNYGRVVEFPLTADGGAGTPSTIVDDCAYAGADGIALDTRDNTLIVAVNIQDKIVRLGIDGGTAVIASGSPLDSPASLFIDTTTGGRRLLFTNASFFSPADAGQPGLLQVAIP
jgi:sugar lactone lactonase YvrE